MQREVVDGRLLVTSVNAFSAYCLEITLSTHPLAFCLPFATGLFIGREPPAMASRSYCPTSCLHTSSVRSAVEGWCTWACGMLLHTITALCYVQTIIYSLPVLDQQLPFTQFCLWCTIQCSSPSSCGAHFTTQTCLGDQLYLLDLLHTLEGDMVCAKGNLSCTIQPYPCSTTLHCT